MVNPEPQTPEESDSELNAGKHSKSSDYLKDAEATEKAFQGIISELSDLSTDQHSGETSRTEQRSDGFNFPRAPWVEQDQNDLSDPTPQYTRNPGAHRTTSDPRGWQDDQEVLDQIDAFVPPNPRFELSKDPARNLGWFLTTFALLGAVLTYMFAKTIDQFTFAVLGILFIAGAGLLVWRMPSNKDQDPHGGAQV